MITAGRRGGRWLCAVLLGAGLFVLAVTAYTGWVEYDSRRPPRGAVVRPAAIGALAGLRDVALRTVDGLTLRAWYVAGDGAAAVVLAHGYGATRMEMLPEARLLAARGCGVLLFDLRAHGESEGVLATFGDLERRDLAAALAFVSAQPGVKRVGMLGVSMAGPPTALVAAAHPQVAALALKSSVVSMSEAAYDEYEHLRWLHMPAEWLTLRLLGIDVSAVDAHAAVRRWAPRPLLILHGRLDEVVPLARVQALFADAREPKQLEVFEAGDHAHLRDSDPARYDRVLSDFFVRTLLSREE